MATTRCVRLVFVSRKTSLLVLTAVLTFLGLGFYYCREYESPVYVSVNGPTTVLLEGVPLTESPKVRVVNAGLESTSHQPPGPEPLEESNLHSFTTEVIDGIEKFVFFVGYPRSGHSIIGSMMDAHPNMMVAHELMLFHKLITDSSAAWMIQSKASLCNALYQKSYKDATIGWHSLNKSNKGYTLNVGTPWHGTYNGSLKVIGDKSGEHTVSIYQRRRREFERVLSLLRRNFTFDVRVIHVVRNPYDMIATGSLYFAKNPSGTQKLYRLYVKGAVSVESLKGEYYNELSKLLRSYSKHILNLAMQINEMTHTLNLTVLEIHHANFTRDPRKTISRICAFLDLPCPEDYLQACYNKAYKTASKSRNLVAWPEDVLTYVEAAQKKIPFFRRYSFEGE